METALWAHHLDGLLFPADPVATAPQLLTALNTYFPAAPGRYVVGPMVKIGWSANLVVGEVAVLLEFPEPLKVLLIGDIQVTAPTVAPQLVLHISFDGGIDFGAKLAFFDATLHDSKIAGYPISGDLAFRYGWGGDAVFALALGGFNPQFQPPAAFPSLKRLAVSVSSSVAKLDAQAYLALTSNTLQFGARAELTAGTGGFNVHGWLGFDALLEKDPLSFEFDLSAGVDLRSGTDVLASVHLDGKLSGPTPWHISGAGVAQPTVLRRLRSLRQDLGRQPWPGVGPRPARRPGRRAGRPHGLERAGRPQGPRGDFARGGAVRCRERRPARSRGRAAHRAARRPPRPADHPVRRDLPGPYGLISVDSLTAFGQPGHRTWHRDRGVRGGPVPRLHRRGEAVAAVVQPLRRRRRAGGQRDRPRPEQPDPGRPHADRLRHDRRRSAGAASPALVPYRPDLAAVLALNGSADRPARPGSAATAPRREPRRASRWPPTSGSSRALPTSAPGRHRQRRNQARRAPGAPAVPVRQPRRRGRPADRPKRVRPDERRGELCVPLGAAPRLGRADQAEHAPQADPRVIPVPVTLSTGGATGYRARARALRAGRRGRIRPGHCPPHLARGGRRNAESNYFPLARAHRRRPALALLTRRDRRGPAHAVAVPDRASRRRSRGSDGPPPPGAPSPPSPSPSSAALPDLTPGVGLGPRSDPRRDRTRSASRLRPRLRRRGPGPGARAGDGAAAVPAPARPRTELSGIPCPDLRTRTAGRPRPADRRSRPPGARLAAGAGARSSCRSTSAGASRPARPGDFASLVAKLQPVSQRPGRRLGTRPRRQPARLGRRRTGRSWSLAQSPLVLRLERLDRRALAGRIDAARLHHGASRRASTPPGPTRASALRALAGGRQTLLDHARARHRCGFTSSTPTRGPASPPGSAPCVVQTEQQQLLAGAWAQVAGIRAANERLRLVTARTRTRAAPLRAAHHAARPAEPDPGERAAARTRPGPRGDRRRPSSPRARSSPAHSRPPGDARRARSGRSASARAAQLARSAGSPECAGPHEQRCPVDRARPRPRPPADADGRRRPARQISPGSSRRPASSPASSRPCPGRPASPC